MLANGSDWSSLVRTVSHGWGPSGRRGCSFMTLSFVLEDGGGVSFPRKREPILRDLADTAYGSRLAPGRRSFRAVADGHAAAGLLDSLAGELDVGDLLHTRFLGGIDVAVGDAVLDRPRGALGVEALVHR